MDSLTILGDAGPFDTTIFFILISVVKASAVDRSLTPTNVRELLCCGRNL